MRRRGYRCYPLGGVFTGDRFLGPALGRLIGGGTDFVTVVEILARLRPLIIDGGLSQVTLGFVGANASSIAGGADSKGMVFIGAAVVVGLLLHRHAGTGRMAAGRTERVVGIIAGVWAERSRLAASVCDGGGWAAVRGGVPLRPVRGVDDRV